MDQIQFSATAQGAVVGIGAVAMAVVVPVLVLALSQRRLPGQAS